MLRSFIALLVVVLRFSVAHSQEQKNQWVFIDLQPKANQLLRESLSENYPEAHLGELPLGEQKLGAAVYKVGPSCICLGSTLKGDKPAKIELPVKSKLTKLYMLHATQFGGAPDPHPTHIKDGTLIGQYMVRYSDGSGEGIEIVYGEDVRDWWNWDKSKETKRGKVAWTGTNPSAKMFENDVRLYESTWNNPKPELEVESIIYSSRMDTPGAPFCVAITAVSQP